MWVAVAELRDVGPTDTSSSTLPLSVDVSADVASTVEGAFRSAGASGLAKY
jgi:hypothetical protein